MILGGGSWKDLEDLKDTVSCQMFGQPKVWMDGQIDRQLDSIIYDKDYMD